MQLNLKFPRALCLMTALLCSVIAHAQQHGSPQGIESLRDRVKEHVLASGMKFLLLERHTSPTVAFHVYFNVGSVDEQVGQTGIAHLYEHMAFKGTRQIGTTNYEEESKHFAQIDRLQAELARERDKGAAADKSVIQRLEAELKKQTDEAEKYVVPNEVGRLFEENGAARINAQTERDQTHYYLSLPSNKIELWMAIESDRIQNTVLRELYTERDVVMEELRRTIDTNPINKLLLEDVITTAFHAHPYGLHSGIGWPSDVAHITRTEVERFFKKYYGGANCTVAIVGDFDTAKIIPMLDRYFSSAPPGEKNPGVVTVEPSQDGERRVELEAAVQPVLALGYHRPNTMSPDDVVYDILEHLLADGRTSRLYKNLVEGKAIAAEVAALPNPPLITAKYPSLFEIIGVPVTPKHTVAELEAAINEELEKLKSQTVGKDELQKIINQVDYDFVRSLVSNETLAELLVFTEGLERDWKRLLTYRQRLAAVTPDDVMRVCRQTFTRSNRTVAFIVPPKEAPAVRTGPAQSSSSAPGSDKK